MWQNNCCKQTYICTYYTHTTLATAITPDIRKTKHAHITSCLLELNTLVGCGMAVSGLRSLDFMFAHFLKLSKCQHLVCLTLQMHAHTE